MNCGYPVVGCMYTLVVKYNRYELWPNSHFLCKRANKEQLRFKYMYTFVRLSKPLVCVKCGGLVFNMRMIKVTPHGSN